MLYQFFFDCTGTGCNSPSCHKRRLWVWWFLFAARCGTPILPSWFYSPNLIFCQVNWTKGFSRIHCSPDLTPLEGFFYGGYLKKGLQYKTGKSWRMHTNIEQDISWCLWSYCFHFINIAQIRKVIILIKGVYRIKLNPVCRFY